MSGFGQTLNPKHRFLRAACNMASSEALAMLREVQAKSDNRVCVVSAGATLLPWCPLYGQHVQAAASWPPKIQLRALCRGVQLALRDVCNEVPSSGPGGEVTTAAAYTATTTAVTRVDVLLPRRCRIS